MVRIILRLVIQGRISSGLPQRIRKMFPKLSVGRLRCIATLTVQLGHRILFRVFVHHNQHPPQHPNAVQSFPRWILSILQCVTAAPCFLDAQRYWNIRLVLW